MDSASAATLTAELTGLSIQTGLGDVLAHRCVSVSDERAQDLWVLLEHGMSFRDETASAVGMVDAEGDDARAGAQAVVTTPT